MEVALWICDIISTTS